MKKYLVLILILILAVSAFYYYDQSQKEKIEEIREINRLFEKQLSEQLFNLIGKYLSISGDRALIKDDISIEVSTKKDTTAESFFYAVNNVYAEELNFKTNIILISGINMNNKELNVNKLFENREIDFNYDSSGQFQKYNISYIYPVRLAVKKTIPKGVYKAKLIITDIKKGQEYYSQIFPITIK